MMQPQARKHPSKQAGNCHVCGTPLLLWEGFRFVLGPDGCLHVDFKGTLPGEAAFVCLKEACVQKTLQEKRGSSFFSHPMPSVAVLLAAHQMKLFSMLGLLKRAGRITLGAEKVFEKMNENTLVLCAQDAGPNTYTKAFAKAQQKGGSFFHVGPRTLYEQTFKRENCVLLGVDPLLQDAAALKGMITKVLLLKHLPLGAPHVTNKAKGL